MLFIQENYHKPALWEAALVVVVIVLVKEDSIQLMCGKMLREEVIIVTKVIKGKKIIIFRFS